jgi:deoxyadenosine/deoxycytidine kinase
MTLIFSLNGNIGSGKSTLGETLEKYYKGNTNVLFIQEPVDLWNSIKDKQGVPIIEHLYTNPEKYAFPFQMMAYISRLSILKEAINSGVQIIITERDLYTDKNVFAQMLYDDGKINEIEFQIYMKWFEEFIKDFPSIYTIYLQTKPETAKYRVDKRARKGENISLDYLQRCHDYHEKWLLHNYKKENCLILDGNIDNVNNPDIMKEWIDSICYFIKKKLIEN